MFSGSSFENDQMLIREMLDQQEQRNIAKKYLPTTPAMTTRQKFTEDNLNSLKLTEEIEKMPAKFAGKCNGGRVDSMTDAPDKTLSLNNIFGRPVDMSVIILFFVIIIAVVIVVSYKTQVDQLREMLAGLVINYNLLAQKMNSTK
jgi:hypothetical protein